MSRLSIVIAGMVAAQPGQGGAAWAVLQYVIGLRSLGHDVTLVDPAAVPEDTSDAAFRASAAAAYVRGLVAEFGLADSASLLRAGTRSTVGLPYDSLVERARRAD